MSALVRDSKQARSGGGVGVGAPTVTFASERPAMELRLNLSIPFLLRKVIESPSEDPFSPHSQDAHSFLGSSFGPGMLLPHHQRSVTLQRSNSIAGSEQDLSFGTPVPPSSSSSAIPPLFLARHQSSNVHHPPNAAFQQHPMPGTTPPSALSQQLRQKTSLKAFLSQGGGGGGGGGTHHSHHGGGGTSNITPLNATINNNNNNNAQFSQQQTISLQLRQVLGRPNIFNATQHLPIERVGLPIPNNRSCSSLCSATPPSYPASMIPFNYSAAAAANNLLSAQEQAAHEEIDMCNVEFIMSEIPFWRSVVSSLNVMTGLGMVSFPYALLSAGWSGILMICCVALVCQYTSRLIGRIICLHPSVARYSDIAFIAFGRKGHILIAMTFILELFFLLVLMMMLLFDHCQRLFRGILDKHSYLLIISFCLLPCAYVRDFGRFALTSFVAMAAALLLLIALILHGLFSATDVAVVESTQVLNMHTLPFAFGIITMGYSCHSLLPDMFYHCGLKNYGRLTTWSFSIATMFYIALAAIGYFLFGSCTAEEVSLNLANDLVMSYVAMIAISVVVLCKFGLYLNPIALVVEDFLFAWLDQSSYSGSKANRLCSFMVRTFIVAVVMVATNYVTSFASIAAFVGSSFCLFIATTFVIWCYLVLFWKNISMLSKVGNIALLLLSVIVGVWGIFASCDLQLFAGSASECDSHA